MDVLERAVQVIEPQEPDDWAMPYCVQAYKHSEQQLTVAVMRQRSKQAPVHWWSQSYDSLLGVLAEDAEAVRKAWDEGQLHVVHKPDDVLELRVQGSSVTRFSLERTQQEPPGFFNLPATVFAQLVQARQGAKQAKTREQAAHEARRQAECKMRDMERSIARSTTSSSGGSGGGGGATNGSGSTANTIAGVRRAGESSDAQRKQPAYKANASGLTSNPHRRARVAADDADFESE